MAVSDGPVVCLDLMVMGDSISSMTTRTTFTLDDSMADRARRLGVNISAAAREGVAAAVRVALAAADRAAYEARPEQVDEFWDDAEVWGDE